MRIQGTEPLLAVLGDAMNRATARGQISDPNEIADVALHLVGAAAAMSAAPCPASTAENSARCPPE